MNRSNLAALAALLAAALSFLPVQAETTSQEDLAPLLRPYLALYEMPALAAAVVKDGRILAAGAVGTRRVGTDCPVTLDDRFHLGSDTKAMTALMAAMLVEQGRLRWDSTPADVFPELAAQMDPAFKALTLEQLLSHTSGLPGETEAKESEPYLDLDDMSAWPEGNLDEIRYWFVRGWSRLPVPFEPGAKFRYSNLNYVIVGAMVERLEGRTWDELIFQRVFEPLGLTTAGLGTQSSLGRIDAPVGHRLVDGKIKAFLAGPFGDNPSMLGPAGIANMSVLDFARWAGWNAGEGKRAPHLVSAETMRRLHTPVVSVPARPDAPVGTPPVGRYGLGWGEMTVAWAPDPLVYHGGSNGMNIARIFLDPKRDFAMVMMTNIVTPKANQAMEALPKVLYQMYSGTGR